MVTPFGQRSPRKYGARPTIGRGLACQNPPVFQRQQKDVAARTVRHRIQLDRLISTFGIRINEVTHTPKRPMTSVQTSDAAQGFDVMHSPPAETHCLQTGGLSERSMCDVLESG